MRVEKEATTMPEDHGFAPAIDYSQGVLDRTWKPAEIEKSSIALTVACRFRIPKASADRVQTTLQYSENHPCHRGLHSLESLEVG